MYASSPKFEPYSLQNQHPAHLGACDVVRSFRAIKPPVVEGGSRFGKSDCPDIDSVPSLRCKVVGQIDTHNDVKARNFALLHFAHRAIPNQCHRVHLHGTVSGIDMSCVHRPLPCTGAQGLRFIALPYNNASRLIQIICAAGKKSKELIQHACSSIGTRTLTRASITYDHTAWQPQKGLSNSPPAFEAVHTCRQVWSEYWN